MTFNDQIGPYEQLLGGSMYSFCLVGQTWSKNQNNSLSLSAKEFRQHPQNVIWVDILTQGAGPLMTHWTKFFSWKRNQFIYLE